MMRTIRTYLLPVLAVVGVAAAVAIVVEGNRAPSATPPVFQPAEAPYSSYIFGPGIVEASSENISIGTPVSGIVTAIHVTWGEQVKRGAPLFKIDTRDLDAQLVPARAKVREVEAQLPSATANVDQAKQVLAKAENHLRVGEGLVPGVSISAEDLATRDLGTPDSCVISGFAFHLSAAKEREPCRAHLRHHTSPYSRGTGNSSCTFRALAAVPCIR